MKNCPYCDEEIKDNAVKCKHCGEWLNENKELNTVEFIKKEEIKIKETKKDGKDDSASYSLVQKFCNIILHEESFFSMLIACKKQNIQLLRFVFTLFKPDLTA